MTKDEIATHLSDKVGINKREAEATYESLIDLIAVELRAHREFPMRDLGTLKPKNSAARTGRNPSTGAAMQIPARRSVKFKIAPSLSKQLNA